MSQIKCILFDMDGTLSDTLDDLKMALNHTLANFGFPLRTRDEVQSFVGDGISALVERGLPEWDKSAHKEAVAIFKAYYKEHLTDYTRPFAGVDELIDELTRKGIKIGIVSNKLQSPLETLVNSFWGDKINAVCGITDYYAQKPAPDMVYVCLEKLGFRTDEAIYVGDSLVDLETAKNADIKFIACSWGFCAKEKLALQGATDIIDTPNEVLKYLK